MPGGNIISCLESKEFSSIIGNIHNGIVDISKTYKSLLVEKYKEKFEECRNCMAYRFCKGGCPLKFLYNDKASEEAAIWECKINVIIGNIFSQKSCPANHIWDGT